MVNLPSFRLGVRQTSQHSSSEPCISGRRITPGRFSAGISVALERMLGCSPLTNGSPCKAKLFPVRAETNPCAHKYIRPVAILTKRSTCTTLGRSIQRTHGCGPQGRAPTYRRGLGLTATLGELAFPVTPSFGPITPRWKGMFIRKAFFLRRDSSAYRDGGGNRSSKAPSCRP